MRFLPKNLSRQIQEWRIGRQQDKIQRMMALKEVIKQLQDASGDLRLADLNNRVNPPSADAKIEEMEAAYGAGVWVYAALNVKARNAASVRWKIVDDENNEVDNPLPERPNELHSWTFLRELKNIDKGLTGNSYLIRVPISATESEFVRVRPSRVRIAVSDDGQTILGYAVSKTRPVETRLVVNSKYFGGVSVPEGFKPKMTKSEFRYQCDRYLNAVKTGQPIQMKEPAFRETDWIPIAPENMIHFKYPHPFSDYYGMSPLQPLIMSLSSELFARQWNKQFFEQGAIPPIVIMAPKSIGEKQFKRLQDQFLHNHKGVKNSWKPFILENETKFEMLANSHTDMDFLNLLHATREETLAVYGVPPVMVGVFQFSTPSARSAGAQDQRRQFWTDTIVPDLKLDADSWNCSGIDFGEGNKLSYAFEEIKALQPDRLQQAQTARQAIQSGLTVEEVREKIWEVGPIPDGVLLLPANLVDMNAEPAEVESTQAEENSFKQVQLEDRRKALWEGIMKQIEPLENRLFRWVKRQFRVQEQRYLESTEEEFNKHLKARKVKGLEDIPDVFEVRSAEEERLFVEAALGEFAIIMEEAGEIGLERAGIDGDLFDLLNPEVQAFLNEKSIRFSREVNQTTIQRLREEFSEAIENGETIDQIRKRIQGVFQGTVRGTAARARMIARTEMTGLFNGATRIAYRQHQDVVEGVEWLSSRDNRVRPTHTAADGQIRDARSPFQVGNSLLRFPGDPQGSVSEIVNCRCTIIPVLR